MVTIEYWGNLQHWDDRIVGIITIKEENKMKNKNKSAQWAFAMQVREDPYWPGEHLNGSSAIETDVAAIAAKRAGQSDPLKQYTTAATSMKGFNEANKRIEANLVQGKPNSKEFGSEINLRNSEGGLTGRELSRGMESGKEERTPLAQQSLEANQMFKANSVQGMEPVKTNLHHDELRI